MPSDSSFTYLFFICVVSLYFRGGRVSKSVINWEKICRLMLWIFIGVNALDILTTEVGLALGLRELNPIVARLLEFHGFFGLYAFKAVFIAVFIITYAETYKNRPKDAACGMAIGSIFVAAVVVWNLAQMLLVLW